MKYEELNCRRMLQIVQSSRMARLAAVRDGEPCVAPVCVRCRMEGYTPVFEVRGADGDLLTALESNAAVLLEFEVPGRGGAVETVLVRGRAAVEQNIPSCPCAQQARWEEYPAARNTRRPAEDPWQQSGRVRFDAWAEPAGESCPCTRRDSGACQKGCGCQRSCGCPDDCDVRAHGTCTGTASRGAAVITVTASEMTGRSYAACPGACADRPF